MFLVYLSLAVGALGKGIKRWRTADLVPMPMLSLWLGLSLWHLRAVADMALITGPLVAASLPSEWWRTRTWPVWVGTVLLIGLTAMAIRVEWQVRDWRWTRGEPRCVESAVERLSPSVRVTRLFGNFMAIQWLLYRLPHRVKVHVTWEYIAGQRYVDALTAIWDGQASLGPYLDRSQVDVIVLNSGAFRNVPLLIAMGWVLVHQDDRFFIMVRQAAAPQGSIYAIIRMWENVLVTTDNAPQVLTEATRALEQCPNGATFAWAYKQRALQQLGRSQEAFEAALKVPERLVIE